MPNPTAWRVHLKKPIQREDGKWVTDYHFGYDDATVFDSEEEAVRHITHENMIGGLFLYGLIFCAGIVTIWYWFGGYMLPH